MREKSESRAARSRCRLTWTAAGVLGIAASACAYGVESEGLVIRDGSVAGSGGSGGGAGKAAVSSSTGGGGNGGDAIIDMSGGSAGTSVDDGSTGAPEDASLVDASDAGAPVVEVGPPCPSGAKALSFDGNTRVDIPGTSLPIGNSPRTVEMWVSPAAAAAPAWSPNHTVFEYGAADLKAFALDMDVPPMMELYVHPAANSFFFNTGISQATWFHVATTYDGATTNRAFVNGADKGSKVLPAALATAVTALAIGGTTAARGFIGSIDEVRVWNVARTAAQIQQTMSTRLAGNEAGLVGYWRFDEGTGTTVSDSSTKGINGAFVGAVTWVPSGVALTCP